MRSGCRRSDPNVLMLGPPGAGTSRLARRLPTLLPALTLAAALETTRIHRVAGRTGARTALVTTRPCRAPHHTLSDAGLIGGRLVKNVIRLSWQQACSLVPVPGQAGRFFTTRGVSRHGYRANCRGCTMGSWSCTTCQSVMAMSSRSSGRGVRMGIMPPVSRAAALGCCSCSSPGRAAAWSRSGLSGGQTRMPRSSLPSTALVLLS
jgi:magnesium chelatase subunit ChlI-like protein